MAKVQHNKADAVKTAKTKTQKAEVKTQATSQLTDTDRAALKNLKAALNSKVGANFVDVLNIIPQNVDPNSSEAVELQTKAAKILRNYAEQHHGSITKTTQQDQKELKSLLKKLNTVQIDGSTLPEINDTDLQVGDVDYPVPSSTEDVQPIGVSSTQKPKQIHSDLTDDDKTALQALRTKLKSGTIPSINDLSKLLTSEHTNESARSIEFQAKVNKMLTKLGGTQGETRAKEFSIFAARKQLANTVGTMFKQSAKLEPESSDAIALQNNIANSNVTDQNLEDQYDTALAQDDSKGKAISFTPVKATNTQQKSKTLAKLISLIQKFNFSASDLGIKNA